MTGILRKASLINEKDVLLLGASDYTYVVLKVTKTDTEVIITATNPIHLGNDSITFTVLPDDLMQVHFKN